MGGDLNKKLILILLFLAAVGALGLFAITYFSKGTTVVFCDVGQGDASYLRLGNRVDIVIDAGPDKKVLDCLGRHMPFWDRTIELAFLTHPQKDHYGGYASILDRYRIANFVQSYTESGSRSYQELSQKLAEKHVRMSNIFQNDTIQIKDKASIKILWPPREYAQEHAPASVSDPNLFSQVFAVTTGKHSILFTGDIVPEAEFRLHAGDISKVAILKVPHHGSTNGLTQELLSLADPATAVISSGKNNSYGHPHKAILEMLRTSGANIRRTDKEGNIVFRF